jgi:hypothetical protein
LSASLRCSAAPRTRRARLQMRLRRALVWRRREGGVRPLCRLCGACQLALLVVALHLGQCPPQYTKGHGRWSEHGARAAMARLTRSRELKHRLARRFQFYSCTLMIAVMMTVTNVVLVEAVAGMG